MVPVIGPEPRVVLYGRPGCHLCDEARPVVAALAAEVGATWAEVDVDAPGHEHLAREYGELVPVVTVDGVQQAFWRVDEARLRRALAAPPPGGGHPAAGGSDGGGSEVGA